tara:strand:- start:236 stop:418 length:183 start_codon:yes stop_codon:yes gene_type:complete
VITEEEFLHRYVQILEEDRVDTKQIVTNVMFLQEINTKEKKQDDFLEFLEHQIVENGKRI